MEDFVGRGDRRLSSVIRRAWELGAGMDAWWESLDRAFAAWTQAIDESGLTWKYRQVENGEWNIFEEKDKGERIKAKEEDIYLSSFILYPSYDAPLPGITLIRELINGGCRRICSVPWRQQRCLIAPLKAAPIVVFVASTLDTTLSFPLCPFLNLRGTLSPIKIGFNGFAFG